MSSPSLAEAARAVEQCAKELIDDVSRVPFTDPASYELDKFPMWKTFVASIDALRAALDAPRHKRRKLERIPELHDPNPLIRRIAELHDDEIIPEWAAEQLDELARAALDAPSICIHGTNLDEQGWCAQCTVGLPGPSVAGGAAPLSEDARQLAAKLVGEWEDAHDTFGDPDAPELYDLQDRAKNAFSLLWSRIAELEREIEIWGQRWLEREGRISELERERDELRAAAEAVIDDEEAGHLDTLRLLELRTAERDALQAKLDEIAVYAPARERP